MAAYHQFHAMVRSQAVVPRFCPFFPWQFSLVVKIRLTILTMVVVGWGAPFKEGRFGHHGPLPFHVLDTRTYGKLKKLLLKSCRTNNCTGK